MSIFKIEDRQEGVYDLLIEAPDMGDAIYRWRLWCVEQSDGAETMLNMGCVYPEHIEELPHTRLLYATPNCAMPNQG